MARAKKAETPAKPKSKTTTKSKNEVEMQGTNPAICAEEQAELDKVINEIHEEMDANEPNAQNELQGEVKTRFESTKELIVSGFTKAKDFIVDCFNGIVDFVKGLFNTLMGFMKGLFDKEQWKGKSKVAKNIFNVIALLAVACILGQLTVAAFGWTGLAIGAGVATIGFYGINRLAMDEDEKETAGPVSFIDAVLPVDLAA